MAAVACLRVLADSSGPGQLEASGGVVAKLTAAFLESRWVWPRRHGPVGPSAFLLADPRALEFDAVELRTLAEELQVKLFGVDGAGEVCLLLFEGEQDEITRFATCDAAALRATMDSLPSAMLLNGQIRRVTPTGVEVVPHKGDPASQARPAENADPVVMQTALQQRAERPESLAPNPASSIAAAGFHAIYYTPRQSLVGCAVSDGQLGASSLRGVFANAGFLQGEAGRRYDASCIEASLSVVAKPFPGLIYFPISYSAIVQRPTRELYIPVLDLLPAGRQAQLAAAVYDVPRDPSFAAMSQLTAFLRKYFGFIDLQVADPGFQVEKLSAGAVNSVTLLLADADPKARLSAVRRFMDNRDSYKRRQIWPAVSHIRTKAEFDFCMAQRTPFLSGPAVSDLLDMPPKVGAFQPADLPLRRVAAMRA